MRSTYRRLFHMIERFSNMALIAVAAVVATGAFATYLHVYDLNALTNTRYGQSLAVKIALFLAVVGVAGYNLMILGPALRRTLRRGDLDRLKRVAARLGSLVRVEAALVTGIVIAAAVLTTLPPADTPGTVIAGVWEEAAQGVRTRIELKPLDRPGQVAIGIEAASEGGDPLASGARVVDQPRHVEPPDEHGADRSPGERTRTVRGNGALADGGALAHECARGAAGAHSSRDGV